MENFKAVIKEQLIILFPEANSLRIRYFTGIIVKLVEVFKSFGNNPVSIFMPTFIRECFIRMIEDYRNKLPKNYPGL